MLLTIDIGNTNTVLGVWDGDKLTRSWRIKTDSRDTADELALIYGGLLAGYRIDGVAACSTVPAAGSAPQPTVSVSAAASPGSGPGIGSATLTGDRCTATGRFPAGAGPFPCSQ